MSVKSLPLIALAGVLWGPTAYLRAADTQDWAFSVAPYLWVAGIEAETSLPDLPSSTPPAASRFDTRISGGALISATARYRSVGLWFDFAWLRLDTESTSPGPAFSAVDLQSDFIHSTMALSYRLPLEGRLHADLLAGGRLWYVNEEITAASNVLPGFNASGDKTWMDPILGADLRYDLTERWSLITKGTFGGFDVAADLAWEVMGGVSYRFSDSCSAALGYRFLHEDYSHDRFTFNTDIQGFILGVGFHF
jgi:opacity protein-like surface antigen